MLDTETGVTSGAQTLPHQGEFFPLLGMIPAMTARLAGLETAVPSTTAPPPPVAAPAPPPPPPQAAISTPQPGSLWREPITGMEFMHVPGGEYGQGCGHWTSDCDEDETPVRKVQLSPFWIGKTEVTQGQWRRVMGSNPSRFKNGDDYPVETVSWNDVQEFIRKLNSRTTEVKYRLPSEAEWEYACRAGGKPIEYGTQTGQLDSSLAKYSPSGGTSAVGSYPANALGLYDMSGNVWEWVQDVYDGKAYQSGATSDPIYQGSGASRVSRGGGWISFPRLVRCSVRDGDGPDDRFDDLGFRLARTR
jgi:formylglycine-generating enzyme required for sulfatase activity